MDKHTFARALAHALNHNTISLICRESWNGFASGRQYEAIAAGSKLKANDDNGLDTLISESAAHFFDVDSAIELAQLPTPAEEAHQQQLTYATDLAHSLYLLEEAPSRPFARYDVLEWKPGLCNRNLPSEGALMIVTEVLAQPEPNDASGNYGNPYRNDMVDLRVGVLASGRGRGREDEDTLLEVCVDSRRVRLWGSVQ